VVEYYRQRASAGLIITEATVVSPQGIGWANTPGIYTPEMVEGWRKVVQAVKAEGGAMSVQLWHQGRTSHSSYQPNNQLPVAPSAIRIEGESVHGADGNKYPHEVPRALELEELSGIVEDYKRAAQHALEVGFDFVELHGANGFLLDEFLQSCSNHRTDAYGGSKENRFRLIREIVEAVQQVFPPSRIGIRLSPNGSYHSMGSEDNYEMFLYVAEELGKLNIGYIHLIDTLKAFHNKCQAVTLDDFRRVYKGILIGNGGYTKETADEAIAAGRADLIAFGVPYLANPDLVERFANNWPLATPDFSKLFTHDPDGYNDYPAYTSSEPEVAAPETVSG
jgi:2,4-dienoyl-CoA reductase-like NADH-dependent reductase (Old Yellow Enzyme family)